MRKTVMILLVIIIFNFLFVAKLNSPGLNNEKVNIRKSLVVDGIVERRTTFFTALATKQKEEVATQQLDFRPIMRKQPHDEAEKEAKGRVAATTMLSTKEKKLLARLVTAEAEGEPFDGKVAVAAVVLNRMENGDWPSTVAGVIMQPRQFQPVSNGRIDEVKAEVESILAVEEALDGKDPSKGAIYFYNPKIAKHKPDPTAKTTVVIGNHKFLK